jgi:Chromate transporter
VSAYVGYKLAGIAEAALATAAIFLPAFILMLSILPIFDRVRQVVWMKAAVKGISPAVIGVLLVTLAQMAPRSRRRRNLRSGRGSPARLERRAAEAHARRRAERRALERRGGAFVRLTD